MKLHDGTGNTDMKKRTGTTNPMDWRDEVVVTLVALIIPLVTLTSMIGL
jgi:hypothetical protein